MHIISYLQICHLQYICCAELKSKFQIRVDIQVSDIKPSLFLRAFEDQSLCTVFDWIGIKHVKNKQKVKF